MLTSIWYLVLGPLLYIYNVGVFSVSCHVLFDATKQNTIITATRLLILSLTVHVRLVSAARPGLYAPHYALLNKMQHGKPTTDVFAHLSDAILVLS